MPGVRTNDGIDFITATEDKKKKEIAMELLQLNF